MAPKPGTPLGVEEDVKFLVTIIKLAGVGTPDWQKVTDELGLPSKGAASKRYSRLPAKYGIEMSKKTSEDASEGSPAVEETPKKKGKAPKQTPTSNKKRKAEQEIKGEQEDEDEE